MIKILLVDDHKVVLLGMSKLLDSQQDFDVIGSVQSGESAFDFIQENSLDVLLMDISMDGMNGIEATKKILALKPGLNVIGLTTHDEPGIVHQMIEAGAKAFLQKRCTDQELFDTIRAVYNNKYKVDQATRSKLNLVFEGHSAALTLTEREVEVLRLISMEHTTKVIADKLSLSVSTIETHRRNLFIKLGVKNAVGLVKKGYELGYLP